MVRVVRVRAMCWLRHQLFVRHTWRPGSVPCLSHPFSYYRYRSIHIQGPLVIGNVDQARPPACPSPTQATPRGSIDRR